MGKNSNKDIVEIGEKVKDIPRKTAPEEASATDAMERGCLGGHSQDVE